MANHLFIGLGGTGGKVLRELRKRVYEEFRNNDPGNGVFLNYVYVDSSPTDLEDRAGWNVLGKSVHLGAAQKVNINGIGINVLKNIGMYPGLNSFLNSHDLQLMQRDMGALISAGIGGQRRRLGRVLMANNIGDRNNVSNFEQVVRAAVGRLQQTSGDNDVTFHICSGLAGGTGSGSIIDAISQIRTWFPYQEGTKAFKIRLFLYIPEHTLVSQRHDAGFYQANGYGALLELNALSIGAYHPTDVTGVKDHFTGEIRRLLEHQEAFEVAYVYSNVNEQGKILDLGKGLPAAVADFIFQTTVASGMPGIQGQLSRLVGCENDGAGPEVNRAGEKTRSRKFLSFGITRVEFPETEIREYMTYTYALQAARQLTFNMWQEGIGYGERSMEEVGIGFADEIKDKKNREGLMLSNNYLTLAKAIVETPATKRWRPFEETWENRTQADANDIMSSVDKNQWLTTLTARCKQFFETQFRQHGVAEFYRIQQQERKGYARTICRHIEKKLFDEWASGTETSKSILEIEKYTHLLIEDCSARTAAFEQQKAKMEEELSAQSQRIQQINAEWSSISFLGNLMGDRKKVFADFRNAKCSYYSAATRAIAYEYGKELLQEIAVELEHMLAGILAFRDELNAISNEVREQSEAKCKSNEPQCDADIKKYDPESVRRICRQFISDRNKMVSNAAAIRSRMVQNLGEDGERTFANLYDKTDYETAIGIVLEICQQNAVRDMSDAATNNPLYKMVGVNILEKLKTELNTESKMEDFVKLVRKTSSSYVQFDPVETAIVIPGNAGAMMPMVQLALPKSDEQTNDFRQMLINAFVQHIPGFDPMQDVAENYKENQIVVVSANSGFPLRFLANVKTAKEKYDALVADHHPQCGLNRMVLHTESLEDELPSLYEETSEEIKRKMVKPLILGYALGIVKKQFDSSRKVEFDAMNVLDKIGYTWIPLGNGFMESLDVLGYDYVKSTKLKDEVKVKMQTLTADNEQRKALRSAVMQVLDEIILPSPLCQNNKFSPIYIRFRAIVNEIIQKELQDIDVSKMY